MFAVWVSCKLLSWLWMRQKNDRTPNAEAATVLMEETKKRGLLIGRGGLHGNILRISPAMNISKSDVENALEKLTDAFQAMNQ